ncbi:Serine/threonine-protein phosphatase 2A 65 kDa regulatory subunit A alpha isoform [Diplonema papillatum]|nr:Serine/threonine-protein phosphatase 2A 65 kDa regulatory subunit A alpha isoform [Diplonema papillatum]
MYGGGMGDEGDVDYDDDQDGFGFEEYAMDDSLDAISRLERYHTSDFSLQRLVLVRELADTAKDAGYQVTLQRMLPLLSNFVADSEPAVRQTFVEQLWPLAQFLIEGGEAGYKELTDTFLPFTFELLVDKNVQVGNSAVTTLIKLVDLVRDEQVEPQLLQVVVTLAKDERAEDYRIVAAQLFNELAPRFGEQRCIQTVIQEVTLISADTSFSVRKHVASSLGKLMTVIGPQNSVERLLPVYLKLCEDDIWGVRKACAEHICEVSTAVTREARNTKLVEAFSKLVEDQSRWVKVGSYQNLGGFIHTFEQEDIPATLIKLFSSMAPQDGSECDYSEYCAYSFPAVVRAVGKERWSDLEDSYVLLVKDVEWKVRRTLSFSLHEIGKVVGPEVSERILTQAFDLFLRDLDEVKIGCLSHCAQFMACLSESARHKHLHAIAALPQELENWRLRELIAQNLGQLAELVTPKVCKDLLQAPAIRLAEDQVADVRLSVFPSFGKVYKRLTEGEKNEHEELLKWIIGLLPKAGEAENLSKSHFQRRQMFVQMAGYCCIEGVNPDVFLDEFDKLASDKVPNVRLTLAKVMADPAFAAEPLKSKPKVQSVRAKLQEDPDRDVQYFFNAVPA